MLQLFVLFLTGIKAQQNNLTCDMAQRRCNQDISCYNSLTRVFATCMVNSGHCIPQCRSYAIEMYSNQNGKDLLSSNMSCIRSVKAGIDLCLVNPKADQRDCSFASTACQLNNDCKRKWDIYSMTCPQQPASNCSKRCAELLTDVFNTAQGSYLGSCLCVDYDPHCMHALDTFIKPCKNKALSMTAGSTDSPTTDPTNGSTSLTLNLPFLTIISVIYSVLLNSK